MGEMDFVVGGPRAAGRFAAAPRNLEYGGRRHGGSRRIVYPKYLGRRR